MHYFEFVQCRFYALVLVALSGCGTLAQGEDDPRLARSRQVVEVFAGGLQAELRKALLAGGLPAAINVCKDVAPAVASELSRQHGAKVGRTSLRVRNAANLAGEWQVDVLRKFDMRHVAGTDEPLEFFETTPDGEARYMRAIPAADQCLGCHGTDVAPEVREVLDAFYPYDRARGYRSGDIRGAFSIVWPAEPAGRGR
jgi:hypothetical protein